MQAAIPRPRFTTDAGPWPRRGAASNNSSDSSTEGDTSRSDSAGKRAKLPRIVPPRLPAHGIPHHNPFHNGIGPNSTETIETLPDPAPPMPYFSAKRHLTCGNLTPGPAWATNPIPWRGSAPGKLKTAHAALVLCLNIDIDPPDIVKTNPCAVLECWVDPTTMPSHKALEAIGSNLQHQFEGLSLKIQYKPILDPSIEDLRKFCLALRKLAKEDAVLFYYNGHGVPKPTSSGELWCFNRTYTQYIPVSLTEIQSWLGAPGVYIWDCSSAGHLLNNYLAFAQRRDHEVDVNGGYPEGQQPLMNALQLAACGANEQLPSCPELPADIFTSCLTSPIDIALRYFIMNHQLPNNITADMVMQLPGDLKDRRTPLGELNWIFTAITDTIAWTTFSRDTFTRLYRCDLLIASLFRNFLLAERIMKNYHCTPHTYPPLPPTNTHHLWATWDLAVDTCLRQLPELLYKAGLPPVVPAAPGKLGAAGPSTVSAVVGTKPGRIGSTVRIDPNAGKLGLSEKPFSYTGSSFFMDQLTAFEVWISRGGSGLSKRGPLSSNTEVEEPTTTTTKTATGVVGAKATNTVVVAPPAHPLPQQLLQHQHNGTTPEPHLVPRKPPDQLPIVLQVLLSQNHRLRALILLSQFVDLGPWAVHLVLTIGIFPYISKLLQAAGQDLRPVLIFIWARILAVDPSVQHDLLTNSGYKYFANVLGLKDSDTALPNSSEHKAMCSFILAAVSRDFPQGQRACVDVGVFDYCFEHLEEPDDFLLRQWTALCVAQMWAGSDDIKAREVNRQTQNKLLSLLADDSAEVRCSALYAIGTFLGASASRDVTKQGGGGSGLMPGWDDEKEHFKLEVAVVTGATLTIRDDASPMCRKELLVVISCLVKEWRGYFVVCAWLYWEEDRKWRMGGGTGNYAPHFHQQQYPHLEDTNQAIQEWLDNFGDDEHARDENRVLLSSFFTIFVVLLDLSVDPYHEVATNAQTIVDYIMALLLESPFTRLEGTTLNVAPTAPADRQRGSPQLGGAPRSRVTSMISTYTPPMASPTVERPSFHRADTMASTISSGVTNTIRRTSSIASALKSLANNITFPSLDDGRASPAAQQHHHHAQTKPERFDVSRPPSPNLNVAQYTSPYSRPPTPPGGLSSSSLHRFPAVPQEIQPPMDFLPSDVMEALMEEDMERLRARKRAGHRASRRERYGVGGDGLPSPSNSTFSMDSTASSVILGLGTGAGIRDVLPLRSTFFDWCCEYFKEPQMRQAEADEPGSKQYNYQVWRQQRNEHILNETGSQAMVAETCRWDRQVASFQMSGYPLTMAFHSFDQHLVVANESDMISVWDWSQRKRLNYFCNGNAKGTNITAIRIINEDVGGIILTGAADGVVRLYRNYDTTMDQGPLQMVSAWRALNEMIQLRQGSGLVMDWKQSSGMLLVGGDSRVIKVWDATTETQGLDLVTNSDSPCTAIVSDPGSSETFLASFADGVVKVFDRRVDEEDSIVRTYSEHTSWVQNVRWHPHLSGQFLSGGLDGQVKLWDLRGSDSAAKTWDPHPAGLASFDVHPQSGVFASTSAINPTYWRSQRLVMQSLTRATPLSTVNISTGLTSPPARALPSPYIPRLSSLVFHPTEMLYGVGEPDGSVRVMGCKLIAPELDYSL